MTYGGLELTKACLASLLERETWPRLDVIVVDNASYDGTPEYLEMVAAADVRVRSSTTARTAGSPRRTTRGSRLAMGEVVVLLNNDTVVPPGLMGRLAGHLRRDASIGLLCPTTNFCGNEARVEPDYAEIAGLPSFAARRAARFPRPRLRHRRRRHVLRGRAPRRSSTRSDRSTRPTASACSRTTTSPSACARRATASPAPRTPTSTTSARAPSASCRPRPTTQLWKKNQAYFEKKFGVAWKAHVPREGVAAVASKVGAE